MTTQLSSRGRQPRILSLLSAVTMLIVTGCQSAHEAHPLPAAMFGNDPDAQLDFWHTLADRKVTTNDEAFHGLLLLLDDTDPAKDYPGRVKVLKDRKLIPTDFNRPADEAVTRGVLAVPLVQALHIKGGLTMRLIGPHPRYALRELVFMGLYPISSPNQTFSGTEFVGVIGKIEDYQSHEAKLAATTPVAPKG